ncbi:MAG: hypothetical protein JWP58_117 [Hymenobacter sp.]|nr:hypothetical protein [Hymenobacter sp.]
MLDFFAIALFQIASVLGYSSTNQPVANDSTPPQTEADGTVGSGGWGNDVTCNDTTVGSGGWGNDITGR